MEANVDQQEECSKIGRKGSKKCGGTGKSMVMHMSEKAMMKTSPWSAFKIIKHLTTKIIN